MVALLAGAVAVHAGRGGELRDRADELESGLDNAAATEDEIVLELFALESAFVRASKRVKELNAQSERVRDATDIARDETQIARRALDAAEENLADSIRRLYVSDGVDSLDVFIGASSIQDAIDGLGALERTASYDDRLLDQVAGAREAAIERRDELRRKQRRVDEVAADATIARRSLAATRAARAAYLSQLRRELSIGRRQVAGLRRRAVEAEARAAELAAQAEAEAAAQAAASAASAAPPPAAPAPSPGAPPEPGPATGPGPQPAPPPPPLGPGAGSRMTVVATAYALTGTTATGLQTRPGIVAVDPRVIPLGSKMFIPGYGEGIAADTGAAVKGAIIDVWLPTVEEALIWGRRTVTITFR